MQRHWSAKVLRWSSQTCWRPKAKKPQPLFAPLVAARCFSKVDVSDPASTEAMAAAAVAEFGGIDILVNNAAMFASLIGGPLTEISVERWDKTMAVNVKGAWLCIKAVLPSMRARGGGAIVNQSSISAFGMPYMLDYTASKAAVIGLTKSVASELGASNIRVNCIAPGGTATEGYSQIMGGNMEMAEERAKSSQLIAEQMKPDAMVGTLLHLVSDGARFVTGQTLVVDGGRYFLWHCDSYLQMRYLIKIKGEMNAAL